MSYHIKEKVIMSDKALREQVGATIRSTFSISLICSHHH